jgi:hypothetical protein
MYGSKFVASLIAAQGAKDAAEGVARDEGAGLFSPLTRAFRRFFPAATDVAADVPKAAPLPLAQDTGATSWEEGWNEHWDNVARALKAPVDDESS